MAFEAAPQLEIPEHSSFHSLIVETSSCCAAADPAKRAIKSPVKTILMVNNLNGS
jgi:hypothetical protein